MKNFQLSGLEISGGLIKGDFDRGGGVAFKPIAYSHLDGAIRFSDASGNDYHVDYLSVSGIANKGAVAAWLTTNIDPIIDA